MKITNQKAELIKHDKHPYMLISEAAHTCYKAEPYDEDRLDLATNFVKRLYGSGHLTTLEHEYVYFLLDDLTLKALKNCKKHNEFDNDVQDIETIEAIKYINFAGRYVSGSFRAWIDLLKECPIGNIEAALANKYPEFFRKVEDPWNPAGAYMVSREELIDLNPKGIEKLIPHTFRLTTSRAVANELVRHRANITFSQESQRYVGYDKDKFGNQIEVITPLIDTDSSAYNDWHYAMLMAETQYMNLRKAGLPPEIARGVLPNDCKTELVVTATEKEWQHIINLRYYGTTGKPHPQMKELMGLILPILHTETKNRVE